MDIINEILWRSLVIFLWMGGAVAIAVGLAFLFAPAKVERINRFFARWVDTSRIEAELDRPHWTERFVYRHHRLAGTLLVAGSFFVLYKFLVHPAQKKISMGAAIDLLGLWEAMVALFVICGVLGAAIGMIMLGKPSLLREIEAASNKWISTDKVTQAFNQMHFFFDEGIFSYRKPVGVFLILAGSYIFFRLGMVLLNGHWAF